MNKHFSLLLGIIIITGLVFSTGCRKFVDKNILASSNNSVATNVFDDICSQVGEAASSWSDLNKTEESTWTMNTSSCATVMLQPLGTDFPKTLTLDAELLPQFLLDVTVKKEQKSSLHWRIIMWRNMLLKEAQA